MKKIIKKIFSKKVRVSPYETLEKPKPRHGLKPILKIEN